MTGHKAILWRICMETEENERKEKEKKKKDPHTL